MYGSTRIESFGLIAILDMSMWCCEKRMWLSVEKSLSSVSKVWVHWSMGVGGQCIRQLRSSKKASLSISWSIRIRGNKRGVFLCIETKSFWHHRGYWKHVVIIQRHRWSVVQASRRQRSLRRRRWRQHSRVILSIHRRRWHKHLLIEGRSSCVCQVGVGSQVTRLLSWLLFVFLFLISLILDHMLEDVLTLQVMSKGPQACSCSLLLSFFDRSCVLVDR
jgi:hypothetical protein